MNQDVEDRTAAPATGADWKAQTTAKPPVAVEVIATRNWDHGVDFLCRWQDPKGNWNSGPMVFADGDKDREIEYTLIDQTGLNLEFEDPAEEAIWVDFGACPISNKPGAGADKGQIKDKHKPSTGRLKVLNANDQVCTLHYALRFKGKSYSTPQGNFGPKYPYDPEYRNGGGGGGNA